jgi:hypothetical protein
MIAKIIFSGLVGVSVGVTTTAFYKGDLHTAAIGFALSAFVLFVRTLLADYYGGE